MILLAFLSVSLFFFFVKDQIASFQLIIIIIYIYIGPCARCWCTTAIFLGCCTLSDDYCCLRVDIKSNDRKNTSSIYLGFLCAICFFFSYWIDE